MRSSKSAYIRVFFFTTLVIIGMVISGKLIYSEMKGSINLSKELKLDLNALEHLDHLNSALTFISRNEKPYIIAHNKYSANEIEAGYKMALTALDSLSKIEHKYQKDWGELDSLKDLVYKKRLLSEEIIRLSLLNKPESAIKLIRNSNDSLVVQNFYLHYNKVNQKLNTSINKLQEEDIKETERKFKLLSVTIFLMLALLLYSIFELVRLLKLKDDLLFQNKTFSDIINFSSDSIMMHDQDFKITFCNKATEDLFGFKMIDILGKDPDALFQTLATPEFIEERRSTIKHYGFWMGELKRKTADGSELDLHITLNSFRDKKGNIKGYFSIASDITKLFKAQIEIKILADSLAEINHHLEDQVADQTALIKDVFERVKEVFIGADATFTINYVSKYINNIFGMSSERVIGLHIKDFLFEIAGPHFVEVPQIAFDTQENRRIQFEQGDTGHWFEANIFPTKNGISIHFKDITDKLRSEKAILKSKKMYEFISKANELILIAKNEDELLQSMCDAAITFDDIIFSWFGKPEHVTGKMRPFKWAGHEDGYFSAITAISIKDLPEGNGPSGMAFRSGKYYYVNDIASDPVMELWRKEALKRGYRSVIAIPIKVNNKVEYVFTIYTSKPDFFTNEQIGLLINISENISFALQAFNIANLKKESDLQLHKVLKAIEQSSASIVISDVKGNIEYVNPAFSILTGYSFEEAIGQNPRILKTGYTSASDYAKLWDNLTNSKEWSGEFCNKKKNGELYWEYAVISPVLNEDGVITNYVAVKENITAQKALQEDQRRLTADLLKRNHDLEKFSYVLSHNIRGPLSNILGLKDALIRRKVENIDQDLLQAISKSAESMDHVIKEVTQVINSTKLSLEEKKQIHFDTLLESVKEDIGIFIQERRAVIESDFSKARSCYSLETYFNSIFYHLIVNALKFSKPEQPAKIQIWTEVIDNKTVIHFKDFGIGIDLKRYGKSIFGLYKRFHLNIEGKGIGLYLVKSQVDFLGGDIEIKSELNQWTECIISLPKEAAFN